MRHVDPRHVDPRHTVSGAGANAANGTRDERAPRLSIVHCFRAPVGGLFRHVRDLCEMQANAGHRVGILADSSTGGADAEAAFAAMAPSLALGVHRVRMPRDISPFDIAAVARLVRAIRPLNPDILHGHGAKGGVYARTVGTLLRKSGSRVARIYTPHGGSLHFDAASAKGRIYFAAERMLGRMTDAFVFVSQYERDTYAAKVGRPKAPATIALNGLSPEEFAPVAPSSEARDFLFIGEIRDLKGPDLFVEALAAIARATGRTPTAVIVGDGPDKARIEAMAAETNLGDAVAFRDAMPAREAFSLARAVVVPSRAEALPYVVLEAAAAGLPLVVTRVGGIPEIFGEVADRLVPPGDAGKLAEAMGAVLTDPAKAAANAIRLRAHVRYTFTLSAMAASVEGAYRAAVSH